MKTSILLIIIIGIVGVVAAGLFGFLSFQIDNEHPITPPTQLEMLQELSCRDLINESYSGNTIYESKDVRQFVRDKTTDCNNQLEQPLRYSHCSTKLMIAKAPLVFYYDDQDAEFINQLKKCIDQDEFTLNDIHHTYKNGICELYNVDNVMLICDVVSTQPFASERTIQEVYSMIIENERLEFENIGCKELRDQYDGKMHTILWSLHLELVSDTLNKCKESILSELTLEQLDYIQNCDPILHKETLHDITIENETQWYDLQYCMWRPHYPDLSQIQDNDLMNNHAYCVELFDILYDFHTATGPNCGLQRYNEDGSPRGICEPGPFGGSLSNDENLKNTVCKENYQDWAHLTKDSSMVHRLYGDWLAPKLTLYTSKQTYDLGDDVYIEGRIRNVDQDYATVLVQIPYNQQIHQDVFDLELNERGKFQYTFHIHESWDGGKYEMKVIYPSFDEIISFEVKDTSPKKSTETQLQSVLDNCACQESGSKCIEPELTYNNDTHTINNITCEWSELK